LFFFSSHDPPAPGNRSQPVHAQNQTLHFRGRAILNALLEDLRDNQDYAGASDVVVSGSSAGGLTVYLHLDAIAATFGAKTRVVGMVDAGYFLDANTTAGQAMYRQESQGGIALWGAQRGSFNSGCEQRTSGEAAAGSVSLHSVSLSFPGRLAFYNSARSLLHPKLSQRRSSGAASLPCTASATSRRRSSSPTR